MTNAPSAEREGLDREQPKAEDLANQLVANLAVLWTKLHQYHWYVKGPHFETLHSKFEELYNDAAQWYDDLAETLLAMGTRPYSTTEQNLKHALVKESTEDENISAEQMVANIVADFQLTRDAAVRAMNLAVEQDKPVLEDMLLQYKSYLDKQIWMLQAFLGKSVEEANT